MKKTIYYLFMLMAVVAMPFTSCDKDPQDIIKEYDPLSDEDQVPFDEYDGLDWLQGCLVSVDENNNIIRRIEGKPLDESQPTVLSISVKDLAAAQEKFLSWVAPGKKVTEVDGGFDYNLTDDNGKAQGSVSFRAVDGEPGVLAKMTIGKDTKLKEVTEVNFIDSAFWPENDVVPTYIAGQLYKFVCAQYSTSLPLTEMPGADIELDDYWTLDNLAERDFYCLQGNDNGKEAILVWLLPDTGGVSQHPNFFVKKNTRAIDYPVYKALPSLSEAQKVLDFFHANKEAWKKMLKEMDALGYYWSPRIALFERNTGNQEFLLNSINEEKETIKCLDLDQGDEEICDVKWAWYYPFEYRYMHIRIFPPATE